MSEKDREPILERGEGSPVRPRRLASLGWRILLWIAFVAFVPLLIMTFQGYHCAREAIGESQHAHLRSVLESRKARLEAWLAEIRADFEFLAISPCLRGDCGGTAEGGNRVLSKDSCGLLDGVKKSRPSYATIETYDLGWTAFARAPESGPSQGDPLAADLKSKLEKAEGLVIASPHLGDDGTMVVEIGRPVFSGDGKKLGYLVARLKISHALETVFQDRAGLGKMGTVYLLSGEGSYLYPPSGAAELLGRKSIIPPEILSGASDRVLDYTNPLGISVLGTSSLVPTLNGIVVAELNRNEAFAWLSTLRTRSLITGTLTLVLVIFIAVKASARLSQPLKELAAVSRKIAAGRQEERVGRLDGIEAAEVGEAFNAMLDELAAGQRRLMQAASLAAVGELSSSIVHEMRNPLSSVKINLQALRQKVAGEPAFSELGEIALEQLARVEKMLADLLNYGKPLQLNLGKATFAEIAKDVLELVSKEAQEKAVAVEVEDRLGQTLITADGEQIRRALTNLLTNAIQATHEGGRVRVTASLAQNVSDQVAICVSDDGPGIPEWRKAELFKPFFTTRPGGTGLGLANVKKSVEYHGGTCLAENRPAGGAMFTILLPVGGPPV